MNRTHYYQEGWLSTANLRGVVGVTYTTSHCGGGGNGQQQQLPPAIMGNNKNNEPDVADLPFRTNYNLRGHRSEVSGEIQIWRAGTIIQMQLSYTAPGCCQFLLSIGE